MQTFLPNTSFVESAQTLDWRRLGKQRVETMQIMQTLLGYKLETIVTRPTGNLVKEYYDMEGYYTDESDLKDNFEYQVLSVKELKELELPPNEWRVVRINPSSWVNHPAVKMWRGYEWALLQYQKAIVAEWKARGYVDTCLPKTRDLFIRASNRQLPDKIPPWLGNRKFHLSHQSNLVRKDPIHYRPLFPNVPDDLPYIWPVA